MARGPNGEEGTGPNGEWSARDQQIYEQIQKNNNDPARPGGDQSKARYDTITGLQQEQDNRLGYNPYNKKTESDNYKSYDDTYSSGSAQKGFLGQMSHLGFQGADPRHQSMDPNAYNMPIGPTKWGMQQSQAPYFNNPNSQNVDDQRNWVNLQRNFLDQRWNQQTGQLGRLQEAATNPVQAANEANRQRQAQQQMMMSQAASQRGGYNPALARQRSFQAANLQQSMAAQTELAKEQERQAAQKAYLDASNAFRQQQQAAMQAEGKALGTEMEGLARTRDFQAGQDATALGWTGLSLKDKEAMQSSKAAYEKMLLEQGLRAKSRAAGAAYSDAEDTGQNFGGTLVKGIATVGGGIIGGIMGGPMGASAGAGIGSNIGSIYDEFD